MWIISIYIIVTNAIIYLNKNMTRILLKLSGEALSGESKEKVFDESVLLFVSESIKKIKENNAEIMLVIGGGNIFRGNSLSKDLKIERGTADYIGMLATIQNALVVRDYFSVHGLASTVFSTIEMPQICDEYIPEKVSEHLKNGRVVIFAAGLGAPYFTTDTTAVQRALELKADEVVYVKNGVDGLYTGDPKTDSGATKIIEITSTQVLERDLKALDQTAVALARDNKLTLRVIGMPDLSLVLSRTIGSTIIPN